MKVKDIKCLLNHLKDDDEVDFEFLLNNGRTYSYNLEFKTITKTDKNFKIWFNQKLNKTQKLIYS
jgi:hypothetical protein